MNRTEKLLKNQTTNIIKTVFLFTLLIFSTYPLKGQSTDSINHQRLNTVVLTGGVLYTGAMIGLNSVWYSQYDKQSLKNRNDCLSYWLYQIELSPIIAPVYNTPPVSITVFSRW